MVIKSLCFGMTLFLFGCAGNQVDMDPKQDFVETFESAYNEGDSNTIIELVNWDGVPQSLRAMFERALTMHAGKHVVDKSRLYEYQPDPSVGDVVDGKKVTTNLKPSYWFEVTTKGNLGFEGGASEYSFKFRAGTLNGKVLFCGPVFVTDPAVQ